MAQQRIQLKRADSMRANLKAGRQFLLVVPDPRLVSAQWDQAFYEPGAQAELLVRGKHLGPLSLHIEVEDAGGAFREIAVLEAQLDAVGDSAKAAFTFPVAGAGFRPGHVASAEWGRGQFSPGEQVPLRAQVQQLEGERLSFIVEEETAAGFVQVARIEGTVEGGACEVQFAAPAVALALPQGELIRCEFESLGATAWLAAQASGLEGAPLHFVLECETESGWTQVGESTGTVRDGKARAGIATGGARKSGALAEERASPATGGARQGGALAEAPR